MEVMVVESPAKARTIEKYLGPNFTVLPTYGHICDLPPKDGSVRPDEDFAMEYVTDGKSAKHLKAIADAARDAKRLLLATDPDREGEAISWHVQNYLHRRPGLRRLAMERVVFHEVTRDAVNEAVRTPRGINMDLVNAQQARRALDYLVGFTLSPVLWRKMPGSRSAGRVQSVALRLIVDREMEIEAFQPREYWSVSAELKTPGGDPVTARLVSLDGRKLSKFTLADEAGAKRAVDIVAARQFSTANIERKQIRRRPPPPFTTSTLQQEASRKLGFSARHTMRVAQRLYDGIDVGGETVGLITYMRTDAVTISHEAIAAVRRSITDRYGADHVPDKPRRYQARAKNAQEAHEAIRPTDPYRVLSDPRIGADERRLYDLIWRRTMACQMVDAKVDQVRVDFAPGDGAAGLRANGSTIAFPGFLAVYAEGRDDATEDEGANRRLPRMEKGDAMSTGKVTPRQHFTEPPPRYTEASLVRKMEELGIGRPSTYANIISVLQDRGYVALNQKRFVPEDRGRLVTVFLSNFFETYVRYDFTARLEDQLDEIANGDIEWKRVLGEFWSDFSATVNDVSELRRREILDRINVVMAPHVFPPSEDGADPRACPRCSDGQLSLKFSGFGAFVGCSNYPDCRYTRQLASAPEDGEAAPDGPRLLGQDAEGVDVTVRKGPYGFYVQLGEAEKGGKPKRAGLSKGMDPATLDLETALKLLSLPREVGKHPETGKKISAAIGRFGPFLRHGSVSRRLDDNDDVLTIGLNRAVALLAEPVRGRRNAAKPIRVLGVHPEDGADVGLFEGRYGPYAKHAGVSVGVPRGMDPDQVMLADMLPLLADKAAAKGKSRRKASAATAASTTRKRDAANSEKSTTSEKSTRSTKSPATKTKRKTKTTRTAAAKRSTSGGKAATAKRRSASSKGGAGESA